MTEKTFKIHYTSQGPALWAYVKRLTRDPDLAHDIVQDAFVRWYLNAGEGLSDKQHRSYLFRTATNLVFDAHRRNRKMEKLQTEPHFDREHQTDLRLDLETIMEHMNTKEKALLWLAYAEAYSHHEIAEILGIRQRSVRVLLHRARKKILTIIKSPRYQ